MIQLFDVRTGEPIAVLDGRLITEMRTAAVSAVATDLLAPQATPMLAILGSGVQARVAFGGAPTGPEVRRNSRLEPHTRERREVRRRNRRSRL